MIFTLISTLKESAEQLISERQKVQEDVKETEARKKEEEENRRFTGEKVTRESFLRWREGFQREMAEKEERRKMEEESASAGGRGGGGGAGGMGGARGGEKEKKLTGRELWERGLVGRVDEDLVVEEGETEGVGKEGMGVEKLKISS